MSALRVSFLLADCSANPKLPLTAGEELRASHTYEEAGALPWPVPRAALVCAAHGQNTEGRMATVHMRERSVDVSLDVLTPGSQCLIPTKRVVHRDFPAEGTEAS